jgi:hypothetical protein
MTIAVLSKNWWNSLVDHPGFPDVPQPTQNASAWTKLLIDQGLLKLMSVGSPGFWIQDGVIEPGVEAVLRDTHEFYSSQGWIDDPAGFHLEPPPLVVPNIKAARTFQGDYEHVRFDSRYEPHADDPYRDTWLDYAGNHTAHAWLLRRRDGIDRPWVIAIHGFGMGAPWADLPGLATHWLHQKTDVNVISYVMPLHGPRLDGAHRFEMFARGIPNIIQTEAQAMWDLRRIVSWIRTQSDQPIGAYGISLGGYTTALLAGLEPELEFAVPGVPATALENLFIRNLPEEDGAEKSDFWQIARESLQVVSPLALQPLVPKKGRFIFGGLLDGLIPMSTVRDLWVHWDRPHITWFEGSHISFFLEPPVRKLLLQALDSVKD